MMLLTALTVGCHHALQLCNCELIGFQDLYLCLIVHICWLPWYYIPKYRPNRCKLITKYIKKSISLVRIMTFRKIYFEYLGK